MRLRALQTAMDPDALAEMADAGTHSIAAYEAYLEGNALFQRSVTEGTPALEVDAHAAFERARALDPNFAAAHLSAAYLYFSNISPANVSGRMVDEPVEDSLRSYLERIDAAIRATHEPAQAVGWRALRATATGRLNEAAQFLRIYATAYPLDADGWIELSLAELYRADYPAALDAAERLGPLIGNDPGNYYAAIYSFLWAGDVEASVRVAREAVAAYPTRPDILFQAHRALLWAGEVEEAAAIATQAIDSGNQYGAAEQLLILRQACAEGDQATADAAMTRLADGPLVNRWLALSTLGRTEEARALLEPLDRSAAPYPLQSWMSYPYFDPSLYPNFAALLAREGIEKPAPVAIPFACRAQ